MDSREFEFLKPLSWAEAFRLWENDESSLSHWVEHYTRRGFNSWRDWRIDSVKELGAEGLGWQLHRVLNPTRSVPRFRGGPFRSWIERIYGGSIAPTFMEIIRHPAIQGSDRVSQIIAQFPQTTFMLGLIWNGSVVIIDGMHRCCAIAIAAQNGTPIAAEVNIALASFEGSSLPLLGHVNSPT